MKKLLLILLLCPFLSYGQGFALSSTSVCFCNASTVTITSTTWTAGTTYILFVTTTATGTPSDNPTISSGSLSLTKIGTVTGTNSRIIAYSFIPASTTTTSIAFTYAQTQGNQLYVIYQGVSLSGYTSISYATNSGSGANPSISMPSSTISHTIGYFFNDKNPFAGTAESGWTEDFDAGNVTPIGHAGYHMNATTDNTIQVTAAASNWIGMGIQYSLERRVMIIN